MARPSKRFYKTIGINADFVFRNDGVQTIASAPFVSQIADYPLMRIDTIMFVATSQQATTGPNFPTYFNALISFGGTIIEQENSLVELNGITSAPLIQPLGLTYSPTTLGFISGNISVGVAGAGSFTDAELTAAGWANAVLGDMYIVISGEYIDI